MFEQLLLDISYCGYIILSKFFENRENYSINFFRYQLTEFHQWSNFDFDSLLMIETLEW